MEENITEKLSRCAETSLFDRPQSFIPKCEIETLMTRANISRIIKMDSEFPFENTSTVIAILIYSNHTINKKTLKKLEIDGLTNDCLPVTLDKGTDALISKSTGKTISPNPDGLPYPVRNSVDQNQWCLLAPVLGGVKHSKYDANTIIPVIEKDRRIYKGTFGIVNKVKIHPAHLDLGAAPVQSRDENPYLAMKQLQIVVEDADQLDPKVSFDREREALEAIQKLQHPHLIDYYGSFQLGEDWDNKFFLLFPWASGGNLKSFWSHPARAHEPRSTEMMRWMLDQIDGLAMALGALHGPKSEERNWRHGDLRPQNIVVFHGAGEQESWGTLQITDAGLARFHELTTNKRPEGTSTHGGSIEYGPPEVNDVSERRGRRYDMWSFGCILLEFIVWMLGGIEDVDALRDARARRKGLTSQQRTYPPFYISSEDRSSNRSMQSEVYEIHPVIKERMTKISKDKRCPRGTLLSDLLQVIQRGLLRVKEDDRFYSEELIKEIKVIVEKGKMKGDAYFPPHSSRPSSSKSITSETGSNTPVRPSSRGNLVRPGSPASSQAGGQKKASFNLLGRKFFRNRK